MKTANQQSELRHFCEDQYMISGYLPTAFNRFFLTNNKSRDSD